MLKKWKNKEHGAIHVIELKSRKTQAAYWILFGILFVIAMICLVPIIWLALTSFKSVNEIYAAQVTFFPKSISLDKVARVWSKMNFIKYYGNSLILCIGDIVFDIVINGLAGYVLSRLRPKGSKLLGMILLWTMMMPSGVSLVPLFQTFLDLPIIHKSLVDSYLPFWFIAGTNIFNLLMFKNFFDSISKEYCEAAMMDGCSNLGIFTKIIIPLSVPIIMVVAILDFTGAWGNFLFPYLLIQNKDLYPVAVKLYDLNNSGILLDEYMMALMFGMIPPLLIFLIFQKQMMNGVSFSGVKG